MSDFFENNQEVNEQLPADNTVSEASAEEESTVFSAPAEHKDKSPKKAGKKRLISIISAFLAVAILVGGTIAVIKLIPEMNKDEAPESIFDDIAVVDADSTSFSSVTVNNKYGEFKFVTLPSSSEGETSTHWTLEGVAHEKLSASAVNAIISSAASVSATREVERAFEDCGFSDPTIKVSVTSKDNEPYTFIVGSESPDGLGYYLTLAGKDTIYITPVEEFSDFDFSLLDISDQTPIPATTFSTDTSANKEQDGSYAYFDSLTFSGKLFPQTVTIINNPDNSDTAALTPYLVATPMKRYANASSLSSPVALFSKTSTIVGNYALDVNDETLKLFGLDDPDAVITLTINGEAKSFKFSLIDNTYCAIVYDGANMIRKGMISDFAFLGFSTENFYYKSIFMNSIKDISNITLEDNDGKIQFNVSDVADPESGSNYTVHVGDKNVTKGFYGYYSDFTNIQCSNFNVEQTTIAPIGTITISFHEGEKRVVEFFKTNETEYQYSIDGIAMGKITSAEYNKMTKNLKTIADGGLVS